MWRDIKNYVQENPLSCGESVRTRHNECSQGRHNDNTLSITRTEDGNYIYYCYRCGSGSGWSDSSTDAAYKKSKTGSFLHKEKKYEPTIRTAKISEFPAKAKLFLAKSKITTGTLESEGIQYNLTRDCIEFPVAGKGTVRRWYAENMPKYTSTVPYMYRRAAGGVHVLPEPTLVIVEDWLSCLQCSLAGYDCIALLTTSIKPQALAEAIAGNYKRVLIVLDNDNVTVIQNQRKLKRTFSLICDKVEILELENDPKEYEINQLQELLQ